MGKQREALEHHRGVAERRRQVGHILPRDEDLSFGGFFKTADHPQCCRLAAAGRPKHRDKFSVPQLGTEVDDRPGSPGIGLVDVFQDDVVLSHCLADSARRLRDRADHVPHGIKGDGVERTFLIELAEHLDGVAQRLIFAGMLAQPRKRLRKWNLPRLLALEVFLHQRIEVLIGLLQRASIVRFADQAMDAVGAQSLP